MKRYFLMFVLILIPLALFSQNITNNPKIHRVAQELERQGFSREEIAKVFTDSRLAVYPEILRLKKGKVDYFSEQFGLFSDASIEAGQLFLKKNHQKLSEAEKLFGVPGEVIVSVLRMESNFGDFLGRFPILNCFYSLLVLEATPAPLRTFAHNELINLFLMTRRTKQDIFTISGSYMGAFGLCQFLPSSYLRYARDGNGDGIIDLFSVADAIFSTANYLKDVGFSQSVYQNLHALYHYNHDGDYTKAILIYAYSIISSAEKKISKGGLFPQASFCLTDNLLRI